MPSTTHAKIARSARTTPARFRARRASLLASVAVLPSLVGIAAAVPAHAATAINYQLGWITNTEFAGTYLAQQAHQYTGLDVKILPGGSNPVEPVVVSGKALIGDSNADTVAAAVANGATDLRIIGARYQNNPFCIISSAAHPLKTPASLIGKTVGINTYNLTAWNVFLALNGIGQNQVHTIDEGYSSGPTPLINGKVDAWMGFSTNEPGVLTLAGFKNSYFLMSSFKYHVYADVYVTTTEAIKTHKAQLVSFMKGEIEGWTKDLASPAAGTALTVKEYGSKLGFSAAQQALENKSQKSLIETPYTLKHGLFSMSENSISQNLLTLKFAMGKGIAKYYIERNLFDPSILTAAQAEVSGS